MNEQMELPIGGNRFGDRPGTRMRIVVPPDAKPRGFFRSAFAWLFKLIYAVTAGMLCVAVCSYAPVAGPAIADYVPARCSLLIQAPSGAAVYRALLNTPAYHELLNDPDMAAFVDSFSKGRVQQKEDAENSEPAAASPLRAQVDAAYAKLPVAGGVVHAVG